jgi:uncharacterized protein YidB (DUF937 family)
MFNTQGGNPRGGMSPIMVGLMGLLALSHPEGKGRLADMPRHESARQWHRQCAGRRCTRWCSGGGSLGAGLKDLLDRFRQSGHEDKVQSWVSTGSNKPIAAERDRTGARRRAAAMAGGTNRNAAGPAAQRVEWRAAAGHR